MDRRHFCRLATGLPLLAAPALLAANCSGGGGGAALAEAKANVDRAAPEAADLPELIRANAEFAWSLYSKLDAGKNVVFSPHSISLALAMTFAGARGDTATEMARALRFELPGDRLHAAFNALDLALAPGEKGAFRLALANAAWGQAGKRFEQPYLETLARYYGAAMHLADFEKDPEASRKAINAWVAERTEQLIKDLLPRDAVSFDTRLVLTNAVYFKAAWQSRFDKGSTAPGDFHRLDGSTVQAPMMHGEGTYPASVDPALTVVELPYQGGRIAMDILMPPLAGFQAFETVMARSIAPAIAALKPQTVVLALPKFSFSYNTSLKPALDALGMKLAFVPDQADLSGMDGTRLLFISDALHKAFVRVDEDGTEAAAATGVIANVASAPLNPLRIDIDRPFVFLIRDRESGAVLFAGRVVDPAAG
ncbi:MAG: serpin family protein [Chloroflexi bacterium]|nr:serpin family protein [Chloroflexota bacterium]